eukprot:274709-Pyramimonas_sp.AAC.1
MHGGAMPQSHKRYHSRNHTITLRSLGRGACLTRICWGESSCEHDMLEDGVHCSMQVRTTDVRRTWVGEPTRSNPNAWPGVETDAIQWS